jgi:hypothetical protein
MHISRKARCIGSRMLLHIIANGNVLMNPPTHYLPVFLEDRFQFTGAKTRLTMFIYAQRDGESGTR